MCCHGADTACPGSLSLAAHQGSSPGTAGAAPGQQGGTEPSLVPTVLPHSAFGQGAWAGQIAPWGGSRKGKAGHQGTDRHCPGMRHPLRWAPGERELGPLTSEWKNQIMVSLQMGVNLPAKRVSSYNPRNLCGL